MTDTFFDLQRFAPVVLGGTSTGFEWDNGEFVGGGDSTAGVGTQTNPAYWATTGGFSAVTGTNVYLTGKDGYSFSIGKNWSIALGNDNTLQVTNGGTSLALGTWNGTDTAVLAINGEYAESVGAMNDIYIKTANDTKVSLTANGYTLAEGSDGVLIGIDENVGRINLSANVSNVSLATSTDTASASILGGYGFEKSAQVFNQNGDITIWTDTNKITKPNGDVLDLKVTDSLLTGPAEITANEISKATGGATLTTASGISGITVNDMPWDITGALNSIAFDSVGAATVDNAGAVTVTGQAGAQVTVKNLDTAGATLNSIQVATALTETEAANVAFTLETVEGGGISSIDVTKALGRNLVVAGDGLLNVKAGQAEYNVLTNADDITFNATAARVNIAVANEKLYTANGNVQFLLAEDATAVSLKSAAVAVSAPKDVKATASEATAGIDAINDVAVGTKVSVSGDSDGFAVNYNSASGDGVFEVNDASINAAGIDGQSAQISVGTSSSEVTVKGLANTDQISVAGGTAGMTYHFTDDKTANAVKVGAGETMYVSLDENGNVSDYIDSDNYKKMQTDENKWNNLATIGSSEDSVTANHARVYEDFYALGSASAAAGNVSVATFADEDSTSYDTVSNPTGIELRGDTLLANAGHVTLTAGSAVGQTPISIQKNESDSIVDVVLDLRNAGAPSTVAIGTLDSVTASHEVHLSNAGVGYAYVGSQALGQNKIFAGTAGAQIRHNGSTRATIAGNKGNDTIYAGARDIVTGGPGADAFYDTENYTIQDYSVAEGDMLIATRLNSVSEINKDNIRLSDTTGNQIGFGTGNKMLTLGTNQESSLNVKVAVMDTNANIVGNRNVAVGGINGGALDASGLDAAAVIIADRDTVSGDNVVGSAYNDTIYVSANDTVNGGAGNDAIVAESVSGAKGLTVEVSAGRDTITGWTFGFDKSAGSTELLAGEGYYAEFDNDRLKIADSTGSILIDETDNAISQTHGEAQVLINGKKYMAIRTDDENRGYTGYGEVASNDELANVYIAEREGDLRFGSGVTKDLGVIYLSRYNDPTNYQDITKLTLANNSKASVFGTSERETVALGGDASVGANKKVSLGAGNDVIISSGDSSVTAGHMFYFGANDGLDTILGFGHYLGIEQDPDKQYADTLVVEKHSGIYTGTDENTGIARIDFYTEGENRIAIYEANGINVDNIYQIKVGAFDTKLAKIGYSNANANNVFTYNSDVDYYVGSSAENAQDTLNVGNEIANANVWLDGTNGTYDTNVDEQYYRGIAVVNASAETNTNVALAGNGNNNTLYGGGIGTNNSLWGGAGNNVLNGSTEGQDTFFYVRNAGAYLQGVDDTVTGGNDTVYNYNLDKGDIVWLGDTTVDDILNTEVGDNSVVVNFKNGGSLTVEGSDDVRFLINSGTQSYVTNKDSESDNKWTQES